MKRILVLLKRLFNQTPIQKSQLNKYENSFYKINYPKDWLISREKGKGIVNLYPLKEYGAITISMHQGINFPISLTRNFILTSNHIHGNPENVKMKRSVDLVIFTYEHYQDNVFWLTHAFRKNHTLYIVTANCDKAVWSDEKDKFINSMSSFTIKN